MNLTDHTEIIEKISFLYVLNEMKNINKNTYRANFLFLSPSFFYSNPSDTICFANITIFTFHSFTKGFSLSYIFTIVITFNHFFTTLCRILSNIIESRNSCFKYFIFRGSCLYYFITKSSFLYVNLILDCFSDIIKSVFFLIIVSIKND